MGESSACLVRSFSQLSPTSSGEKKGNPLQRALTSSISFGRFMSESLDWEKWSAFNHNRYMEEVEKYSKPGSVAEKKAYFEAHFKRRRAAKLLELQNEAASTSTLSETNATHTVDNISSMNLELTRKESHNVAEKANEGNLQNYEMVLTVGRNSGNLVAFERTLEETQLCAIEENNEPSIDVENQVELANLLKNNEEEKICDNDAISISNSQWSSEEKTEVSSSSKISKHGSESKNMPLVKPIMPSIQINIGDKRIPNSKNKSMESSKKRRSTATSLHTSIVFASGFGDTQKINSPNLPKIANSKLFNRPPPKKFINSRMAQASVGASVNGEFKHHPATPPPEKRRTKTLPGELVDGKMQSSSKNHSQSLNIFGSKVMKSSTVSAPFTFRSEERAAKRKEFFQKLQKKWKSKEMVKDEPRENLQVKAKRDLKKHPSSADIPLITKSSSNNLTEKTPNVKSYAPKIQERVVFKARDNDPRPPWRFSLKTDCLKDNGGKKTALKKSMRENDCPNIQV